MANITDIANVNISIEEASAEASSFSRMLIVTDAPASTGTATLVDLMEVTSPADILAYGYTNTSAVYKALDVAFKQTPKPDKIYVTYLHVEESVAESITAALTRVLNGKWYGFVVAKSVTLTASEINECATFADTNAKLFGFSWTSGTIPATITGYDRTYAMYAGSDTANTYIHVAWMAKCFGYECGSETWGFKTLKGMVAVELTSAEVTTLKAAGANTYQTYAGHDITLDGKVGSGEWIDVIRFRDWLKSKIETEVVNFFVKNTKVAYTDAGITGVYNVLADCLKTGQNMGGIAPDSSDTDGEVIPGFTITVPRASEVSDADKASRRLTNVKFTAVLAGAIHYASISGTLTY